MRKRMIKTAFSFCMAMSLLVPCCMIPTYAAPASYTLWNGEEAPVLLENGSMPELPGIEYHWIKYQESDGVPDSEDFLLGVTIEEYHGALLATWAYDEGYINGSGNRVIENTIYEETWGAWSYDGGETWEDEFQFEAADLPEGEQWATSHGVSFVSEDTLYYLLPCYQDRNPETKLRPMRLELHRWDEENQQWEFVSTCAENFWPNSRPVLLDNGKWFMVGAVSQYGVSGYAISENTDDLTSFTVTPTPGTGTGDPYYNESSFWVDDDGVITIVARNNTTKETADPELWGVTMESQKNQRYPLMISRSDDGGETFSELESSHFYTSPSRVYCGRLSDGRPYILFNQSNRYNDARRRLLLGIGDAGTSSINRLYTVEDYSGNGPGGAKGYPFAVEADGKLYISYAYSVYSSVKSNRNHARVAVVPLSSIPEASGGEEELQALYDSALEEDGEGYTSESFERLQEAILYAEQVLQNQAHTTSMVDMAVCRVKNAMDSLETEGDSGEDGDEETPSSQTAEKEKSVGYALPYAEGAGPGRPAPETFESDTTEDLTVQGVYQFRITSLNGAEPVMRVSSDCFRVELVSRSGGDYFFKVFCTGDPGSKAAVLVNDRYLLTVTAGNSQT